MTEETITPTERCLAILALQLNQTAEEPKDAEPQAQALTDDTLLQLYNGTLNAQDRAAALHQLAHNPAEYQRWLGVVESYYEQAPSTEQTAVTVETQNAEQDSSQTSSQKTNKTSLGVGAFVDALKNGFSGLGLNGLWSVNGLAAVSVFCLAVMIMLPGHHRIEAGDVDALYTGYGQGVIPIPTRNFSINQAPSSAENKLIEQGANAGRAQLLGNASDVAASPPQANEQEPLFLLGKVMVLAHAKCQDESLSDDFVKEVSDLYRGLVASLSSKQTAALNLSVTEPLNANMLCMESKKIIVF